MKKYYFIIFLLLLAFTGCNDDGLEKGHINPAKLIQSVTAAAQQNNVLRINIQIEFKAEATYQIEYWKKEKPELVKKTKETASSKQTTLVLLEPRTTYDFRVLAKSGDSFTETDIYQFTTQSLPSGIPTYSLQEDKLQQELPGYLLITRGDMQPGYIILTDTKGQVLWYENTKLGVKVATFDTLTNTICSIIGTDPDREYNGKEILIMDLFGNTIFHKDYTQLGKRYFHHDIRKLPNGNIIFVNYVPKQFDLTAQGGSQNETVFGDGLTIMDEKGNFLWTWDCFSEINPADDPNIMGDIFDIPLRTDWIHANCVNFDKAGNYYMSFNWLNEVWKIDAKTGKVLYRLGGKGGNIAIPQEGYTNGLHSLRLLDNNKILLFENGIYTHQSRALIFTVNETNKTATLDLNVSLPSELSSPYMSSVDLVDNNLLIFGSTFGQAAIFTDLDGNILRLVKSIHQSFRFDYIPRIDY